MRRHLPAVRVTRRDESGIAQEWQARCCGLRWTAATFAEVEAELKAHGVRGGQR